MNPHRYTMAACILLLLSCGCASTMRVKVELIEPRGDHCSDTEASLEAPSLVQTLQNSADTLDQYRKGVAEIQQELPKQFFDDVVAPDLPTFKRWYEEGRSLAAEAPGTIGMPARYDLAIRIKSHIRMVSEGCSQRAKRIMNKRTILSAEEKRQTGPLVRLVLLLQAQARNAQDESVQKAGFGGLQYCGTNAICPGDPRYRDVVRGKPAGVISEAKTGAFGNSTIVFFQETPTEIKNFSTDLNAEQLMKNVAYVSDKAVTAFAKYLSASTGMPAP